MHKSRVSISILLLPSYALSAVAASLAQPSPVSNDNLLSTTSGNVVQRPPMLATGSVPIAYRNILFDFTSVGDPIPQREVENAFTSADEAITELADERPFESIANNRFEHRAPGGNTLISIQANVGKKITWAQLLRLLQGLYRFMIGNGVRQQNCHVLDFTIAIAGQERVGLGVIRYFPHDEDQIRKRSTISASNMPHNETVLHRFNGSSLLSASTLNAIPILFSIPGTSLVLSFHFLGTPIPKRDVRATLQGAIAVVRQWLNEDEDEAIKDDAFDWVLPPNGDGTRTGITVLAYHNCKITWGQLFQILFGLFQFITASKDTAEEHFQALGFRIINRFNVKIGVGTLSHYPRRLAEVERRVSNTGQHSLQLPNRTSSALATVATGSSILWPVRDTNVVLDFVFLGQDIPAVQAIQTLGYAQMYVADVVRELPHTPILNDTFSLKPEGSDAYINVVTNRNKSISWLELSQILFGVMQFCDDKKHRVLVFDIDMEGVRVGFGTLLYFEPDLPVKVEKRAINRALTGSHLVAGSVPVPYNIPNTKDYLDFNSFGKVIPRAKVIEAISYSLQDISEFVQGIPKSRVPRNRYIYDDDFGVSIDILPSNFIDMTWSQLDNILTGLMCFVTGVNPRPGGNLKTHYQVLAFNIVMHGQGYIGTGLLDYKPPSRLEVSESDAALVSIAAPNESLNRQPSGTVASPPTTSVWNRAIQRPREIRPRGNASGPVIDRSDIHFPIIGTSMTLVFTKLGAAKIPIETVSHLFSAATEDINSSVTTKSNSAIPGPLWYFKVDSPRGGATLSLSIYTRANHKITWQQLKKILSGLQLFMGAQRSTLNFDVDIEREIEVAKGVIWYSPPQPLEIKTAAKRAITPNTQVSHPTDNMSHPQDPALSLPDPSAALGIPIPHPVPSTPMILTIYLNGPVIPFIYLSACLTTGLRHIQSNVTTIPEARVPWNGYHYSDRMSGWSFDYLGYSDTRWLTWLQLNWILRGILGFVSAGEASCRGMAVEVDIRNVRFGGFILWYVDVEGEG